MSQILEIPSDKKSVREVAQEMLHRATLSDETRSTDLETELDQLAQKSDDELFEIAQGQLPAATIRHFNRLINKHEAGEQLSSKEKQEMEKLIKEGDRWTVIKSEAYVLLKQRGHQLPTLQGKETEFFAQPKGNNTPQNHLNPTIFRP